MHHIEQNRTKQNKDDRVVSDVFKANNHHRCFHEACGSRTPV